MWKKANEETNSLAADALKLTAVDNLSNGFIDDVIPEPSTGAHRDPQATAKQLEHWIVDRIRELKRFKPQTLVQKRYERLRNIGEVALAGTAKPH